MDAVNRRIVIVLVLTALLVTLQAQHVHELLTRGAGPPLPVRIYAMLKLSVTPVVNALGVLMVIVIALVAAMIFSSVRLASRRAPLLTQPEEADHA